LAGQRLKITTIPIPCKQVPLLFWDKNHVTFKPGALMSSRKNQGYILFYKQKSPQAGGLSKMPLNIRYKFIQLLITE